MRTESRRGMAALFAAAILTTPLLGCKEAISPEQSSSLTVRVNINGVYPFDAFRIQVDDRELRLYKTQPILVVTGLPAGAHSVSLVGLAENCQTNHVGPVAVETSSANPSNVSFDVTCAATSGSIAVSVSVAGDSRQLWFQTQVDSSSARGIAKGNATTILFGSFPVGRHVITLSDIPTYCEATGAVSTEIFLKNEPKRDTAVARFNIQCIPPEVGVDTAASIVFERDRFVMVMNESGSAPVALTEGEAPAWSPDGKLIAFQRLSCRVGAYCEHDLWLTTPAGVERRVAEIDWLDDYDASFNPKSDRIAFIRNTTDETYLTISDLSGGSEGFLAISNPIEGTSWSPDGTRIVFGCALASRSHRDLCIADTAFPCSFNRICSLPVNALTDGSVDVGEPAWSPDGDRVAFTIGCTRYCTAGAIANDRYIAVIDVATRTVTSLVAGHDPAWSSDASQLVFVGNESSPGLRVFKFADGSVRQLTTNPADKSPSWRFVAR